MTASDGGVPMIYRTSPRVLTDGCLECGLSLTLCQGLREMEGRTCCDLGCRHPN